VNRKTVAAPEASKGVHTLVSQLAAPSSSSSSSSSRHGVPGAKRVGQAVLQSQEGHICSGARGSAQPHDSKLQQG
jgi:hypothetical protein